MKYWKCILLENCPRGIPGEISKVFETNSKYMTIYDKFSKKAVWLRLISKSILYKLWDHFCLIKIDVHCVRHNLVIQMLMKSLSTSTEVQIRVIYYYFRPYPHYMCFVFKYTNMRMFSSKDPGGHYQIGHIFQTCSNRSRTDVQILVGSKM